MAMRRYGDEERAAVMAALLDGQSVSSVAKLYNIPKGTVSDWKRVALRMRSGVGETPTQKRDVGELLYELLIAELGALIAQARAVSNETWLREQSASELAVLRGVGHDKLLRLLQAYQNDGEAADVS